MKVERLTGENIPQFARLAQALWSDSAVEEERANAERILQSDVEACFLASNEQGCIGFIYLALRHDYVEGTNTSPVAYIEGIYVVQKYRRFGVGKRLVEAAGAWAREKGCSQLASDAELGNHFGIEFHQRTGFREVNRIVCFVQDL